MTRHLKMQVLENASTEKYKYETRGRKTQVRKRQVQNASMENASMEKLSTQTARVENISTKV